MSALAGEVKLPAVGQVKRSYLVVGGLVVVGAAFLVARNRKAAAAASSTAVDPATQTYAPVPGGDQPGAPGGGSSSVDGQVTSGPPFTSNAAWSQYAEAQLSAITNGPDPGAVAAALGAYLAGQPVTADQRHIIEQAIAFADAVPVAGPNGFPPSINQSVPNTGPNPPPPTQTPPTQTPPTQTPPTQTPPPPSGGIGPGQATSHTTITAGESVAPVLAFFGMTKQQLDDLNPGITYYTKPGGVLAFGVTRPVVVLGGKGW